MVGCACVCGGEWAGVCNSTAINKTTYTHHDSFEATKLQSGNAVVETITSQDIGKPPEEEAIVIQHVFSSI